MRRTLASLLFLAAVLALAPAAAQDKAAEVTDLQALRNSMRSDERAFVGSIMKLSDAEARKFWPIYDNYQRDVEMADRRRTRVLEEIIGRDRPVSDVYAKNLLKELLAADEIKVAARRTMQNRLLRALPPRKAARFMQLDSKMRAVQDYDVAATIPLVP